jgi:hypothetical protein
MMKGLAETRRMMCFWDYGHAPGVIIRPPLAEELREDCLFIFAAINGRYGLIRTVL